MLIDPSFCLLISENNHKCLLMWRILVLLDPGSRAILASIRSFHWNEWDPAYNAVSSSLYTSSLELLAALPQWFPVVLLCNLSENVRKWMDIKLSPCPHMYVSNAPWGCWCWMFWCFCFTVKLGHYNPLITVLNTSGLQSPPPCMKKQFSNSLQPPLKEAKVWYSQILWVLGGVSSLQSSSPQ